MIIQEWSFHAKKITQHIILILFVFFGIYLYPGKSNLNSTVNVW